MSKEYWETLVKGLNVKISHLEFVSNEKQEKIEDLQQRIDKANEILSKSCFEYDNCPDSVINEIIELKEILGDKENENI